MVMAETSTFGIFHGRNVRGRNVLAEMSVAETSVAEISYILVALLGQDLYFIPFDSFALCHSLASLFHKQKTIIGISNPLPV